MKENKELQKFIIELEVEVSAMFQGKSLRDSNYERLDFIEIDSVEPIYYEKTRSVKWIVTSRLKHKFYGYDKDDYGQCEEFIGIVDELSSLNVVDNATDLVGHIEAIYDELNFEESDIDENKIKEVYYGRM